MPYSNYSKIFDILSFLESTGPINIFDLSRRIHDEQVESFTIWRRSPTSSQPSKSFCSPASIRRLIRFLDFIELIEIDNNRICKNGQAGTNALKGENYPVQLSAQLMKYMRVVANLSFEELESIIDGIDHPQIADYETLFDHAKKQGLTLSDNEFRRLLYLLQRCGKLQANIKKIYLKS